MELKITIDEATGALNVQGPIDQKLICYGVLEMAKEAICQHHIQKSQKLVQPVLTFPDGLKRS